MELNYIYNRESHECVTMCAQKDPRCPELGVGCQDPEVTPPVSQLSTASLASPSISTKSDHEQKQRERSTASWIVSTWYLRINISFLECVRKSNLGTRASSLEPITVFISLENHKLPDLSLNPKEGKVPCGMCSRKRLWLNRTSQKTMGILPNSAFRF